jgi:hypothetical protein
MAKPAFKWMIIANVIVGFTASSMGQDANQGKAELPKSNTPFAARWSQNKPAVRHVTAWMETEKDRLARS